MYCQFEPLPGQISVTLLSAHPRQSQGHLLPLTRHVTSMILPLVTGLVLEGPVKDRSPSGLKEQVKEYYYSPSFNRLFPSCLKPLFQSEANFWRFKFEDGFYSYANKIHFHNKGLALSLVLKVSFWNSEMAYFIVTVSNIHLLGSCVNMSRFVCFKGKWYLWLHQKERGCLHDRWAVCTAVKTLEH